MWEDNLNLHGNYTYNYMPKQSKNCRNVGFNIPINFKIKLSLTVWYTIECFKFNTIRRAVQTLSCTKHPNIRTSGICFFSHGQGLGFRRLCFHLLIK